MRTYRYLTCALIVLILVSLGLAAFLGEGSSRLTIVAFNVSVAVFSVALVALIVFVVMYAQHKNSEILVLKRRGGRIYGELLQYKIKLIEVMDGEKPLADWENFLYNAEEFPRIKRFLNEEYFLLLNYDPFFENNESSRAVFAFRNLHKEFETFTRSVRYDLLEHTKFRRHFWEQTGRELTSETPEEDYAIPAMEEEWNSILMASEYALFNVDRLLKLLDELLTALDAQFRGGVAWAYNKQTYNAEFQIWMSSKD